MNNPFDTLSNTKQNDEKRHVITKANNKKASMASNLDSHRNIIKKHKKKNNSKSGQSPKSKDINEINQLKSQYSTVRLTMYDTIRLKILQAITGRKSRSDLINNMIKIVSHKYLNSSDTREKYEDLFNYVIKGLKMRNKFNELK